MTFETFDVRGNEASANERASLGGAFQAARNFAADPDGWLTMFGTTGAGKTHLAIAIAAHRRAMGLPVFFAFVPDLLDYVRFAFTSDNSPGYDRLFYEVKGTPLLILDDLGLEDTTPWTYEKLYQVIVHRHNARLATVITSSEDFTKAAGPIGSRVRDPYVGQLVRIDAPDYRIKDRDRSNQRLQDGERRKKPRR
jgi:DNA replication protein DnaC